MVGPCDSDRAAQVDGRQLSGRDLPADRDHGQLEELGDLGDCEECGPIGHLC
jgi:hypothetical protein